MEEKKKKRKRIAGKRTLIATYAKFPDKIEIKEDIIKKIGKIADKEGYKIYIVGGYVRDYFLERQRTDFDFTIVGDSIAFAKLLAKKFKTKAVLYPKFRTAMVPIDNQKFEFVGTRKEIYEADSRDPIVDEGTLEDDLKRRDFTCNAIAVSLNKEEFGNVVDIFNSKRDLENGLLRTPLDPYRTFNDDPLRMLRAVRFASQLGFTIEEPELRSITHIAERINIISIERIRDEFLKILASNKPSVGLKLLKDTRLIDFIFPDLSKLSGVDVVREDFKIYRHKNIYLHSLKVVDKVAKRSDNIWLRFAALIHDIAKPITKKFIPGVGWSFHGHEELGARRVEKIFRDLKLPLENMEYVEKLVRLHQRPMTLVNDGVTESAVRRLAFNAGDALEDLFLLCRADITTKDEIKSKQYLENYDRVAQKVIDVQEKDKLREFQSPVRGEEIMELCKIKPSRSVGIIKTLIEEAILDGIIPNEYDAAKKYLQKNKKKWLKLIEEKELV